MAVKFSKLIGLKKEDFDILVKQPDSPIHVRPARLIPVGFGMTSAIIKHRCVEQAYAISPWSQIKDSRDKRFEVTVEDEDII